AATADGNGTPAEVGGYGASQEIEIEKTGTGTATATIEGSFDQTTWYAAGYEPIDAQATLTRSVTGISVLAGTFNHTYLVLDHYPFVRLRLSSTSGTIALTGKLYAVPD